jgi:hypothetical protein
VKTRLMNLELKRKRKKLPRYSLKRNRSWCYLDCWLTYKYSRKRTRNHVHECKWWKIFAVCCMFCVFFSYSLTFYNLLKRLTLFFILVKYSSKRRIGFSLYKDVMFICSHIIIIVDRILQNLIFFQFDPQRNFFFIWFSYN